MNTCIDDDSKQYNGNEPSPLGLGYSADIENIGRIMMGFDKFLWIVDHTKKWVEFNIDFDKLPDDCYSNAYCPNFEKCEDETDETDETGLENKFGGTIPFFIKGEKWPTFKDIPMVFAGQFIDPRYNNNELYRIFLSIDNQQEDSSDCDLSTNYIDKIILNEENLKNQIIIEKPETYPNIKFTTFKLFKINNWTHVRELKTYEFIVSRLSIPSNCNILLDEYMNHDNTPGFGIKIGGTPCYCQWKADSAKPSIYERNILQLTGCDFFSYDFGDCGIGHIIVDEYTKELYLEWDCC